MRENRFFHGLALGLALSLAYGLGTMRAPFREALADNAAPSNEFLGMIGNGVASGDHDIVFLDTKGPAPRMLVYSLVKGELALVAVRDVEFDLKFVEYGKQKPTVTDVRETTLRPPANP